MPILKIAVAALAATLTLASGARAAEVHVFAAASLQPALDELAKAYGAATGDRIVATYGASSALARQIEQGAPAELFIAADEQWMDYLAERQLIVAESRRDLLSNRLVLIAPAEESNEVKLGNGSEALLKALGDGRLAVGAVDHVPAGRYAKAALMKLGLWEAMAPRLAEAENVRACLAYVARGEAPLGIVYASDALSEPRVKVLDTFPPDSHLPITYPAALVGTEASPTAKQFLEHLTSPEAQVLFTRFGFSPLPSP